MTKKHMELECKAFLNELASAAPVPGGGSVSAFVGAIGTALANMVGNLTIGKKNYAEVQDEVKELLIRAAKIQNDLVDLVAGDVDVFSKLSNAYGMPKDSPEALEKRKAFMQASLKEASEVPIKIMEKCCEAIQVHEQYVVAGNRNAISDVGVGVLCCKAALQGASLNIIINLKSIEDEVFAKNIEAKMEEMLQEYGRRADAVYQNVLRILA